MSNRMPCLTCGGWGTVTRPDGKGTEPCPRQCPAGRQAAAKQKSR